MSELASVTIIVLNWNGRAYLHPCLSALLSQTSPSDHIILADNASSDDSLDFVRRTFPVVDILDNDANLGYAAGNNRALQRVKTDIAILVNPDIVVQPGWLAALRRAFKDDVTVGVAGCKLFFPGEELLQHAGGVITHPQALPGHRGIYSTDTGAWDVLADVDFVTGAAFAVRREAIEAAGLLDEGFFMYFEDADWCARARRHGFRVVYVPEATAVHDESATAVQGSPAYLRHFHAGRWRYLLKHFAGAEILADTIPAEAAWLEGVHGTERRALAEAYRRTALTLPHIAAARVRDGVEPLTAKQQDAVKKALWGRRSEALECSAELPSLSDLKAKATVRPQPFSSETPAIGPLLARLRTLWADIEARPYVDALNSRQNDFNAALAAELEALESRLAAAGRQWLEADMAQGEITAVLQQIEEDLAESARCIAEIDKRLARLTQQKGGK
jgi:GT2 family glycosyltransferase